MSALDVDVDDVDDDDDMRAFRFQTATTMMMMMTMTRRRQWSLCLTKSPSFVARRAASAAGKGGTRTERAIRFARRVMSGREEKLTKSRERMLQREHAYATMEIESARAQTAAAAVRQ